MIWVLLAVLFAVGLIALLAVRRRRV